MERLKRYLLFLPSIAFVVLLTVLHLLFGSLLPEEGQKLGLPKKAAQTKKRITEGIKKKMYVKEKQLFHADTLSKLDTTVLRSSVSP